MPICTICGRNQSRFEMKNGECAQCRTLSPEQRQALTAKDEPVLSILLSTETTIDLPIESRLGIVASERVYGINALSDLFISATNVFGGQSETLRDTMREARQLALGDMQRQALDLGADAVIAINIAYSQIGTKSAMLMLIATGTAVKLGHSVDK